ncbi:MAG: CRISPR-associated endonuclease Cas1 [Stenomitos frigidus ULC029]
MRNWYKAAVQRVGYWRDQGYEWVLDGDLVCYFDNVQHDRLFAEVEERVKPDDLIPAQTLFALRSPLFGLLAGWIEAGVQTPEGLVFPAKGIAQGSVVSPILANVYLDDFDESLRAEDLKLVRFADDFVVMAKSQDQIIQAQQDVADALQPMGLQLHPEKTQLTDFDRGFRFLGHAFAGNLIVPVQKHQPLVLPTQEREESHRLAYADPTVQPTQMQQAMVATLKAAHQPIPPPLYVVLGYSVREWKPITIESQEWEWKPDMTTLYLVQQGTTLRKEQGRFLIEAASKERSGARQQAQGKESPVEIPIAEVERVLVFGQVQLTTAAITACLEAQIPVVFLSQLGDYKGHLWSAELTDLPAEAMQFQRWQDTAFQLGMAKSLVFGKLMNSKQLLLRLNRKRQLPAVVEAIQRLDQFVASAETTDNLESLRGFEGISAAVYFPALGQLLTNSGFSLTGRNRRPPTDPPNSLLSFGYTLLFHNVMSLLLAEGLNPYLGNLHRSERKEPHLAFDLMEEFRSPVVDSLMVMLVNKQILKPTDFTWPNQEGGVYLHDTARRVFLKQFEERMSEPVTHPAVQAKVSYRRAIQLQIQQYKRCLLESTAYEPFLRAV